MPNLIFGVSQCLESSSIISKLPVLPKAVNVLLVSLNASRINLPAGKEVVYRPYSLPYKIFTRRYTRKQALVSEITMFDDRISNGGEFYFRVIILNMFALSRRVNCKHDHPFFYKIGYN